MAKNQSPGAAALEAALTSKGQDLRERVTSNLPAEVKNSGLVHKGVAVATHDFTMIGLAGVGGYEVAVHTLGHLPLVGGVADLAATAAVVGGAYYKIRKRSANRQVGE